MEINNKPLVSVCVQTYQHVHYIQQCLDGILSQKTSFEFEILLGEDESKDGTREICIEYADKHSDVINLFLNKRENVIKINGIPTGRWNLMNNLKYARGKYIAICEGDDYWEYDKKLEEQVKILENDHTLSMSFHNTFILNSNGKKTSPNMDFIEKPRIDLKSLMLLHENNFISTCSVMYRKSSILPLPAWFTSVLTADFALHFLAATNGDLFYIDKQWGVYRKQGQGIWGNKINPIIRMLSLKDLFTIIKTQYPQFEDIIKIKEQQLLDQIPRAEYEIIRRSVKTDNNLTNILSAKQLLVLIWEKVIQKLFKKV